MRCLRCRNNQAVPDTTRCSRCATLEDLFEQIGPQGLEEMLRQAEDGYYPRRRRADEQQALKDAPPQLTEEGKEVWVSVYIGNRADVARVVRRTLVAGVDEHQLMLAVMNVLVDKAFSSRGIKGWKD